MKTLSDYFSKYLPAIDQEIAAALFQNLESTYPELREAILYQFGIFKGDQIQKSGKKIRPCLVLLTTELIGKPWKNMLPAAAASEMFHNYTLIHDDIEDHSPLRRGRDAVWKKWGVEKAINIGDTLFTVALLSFQERLDSFSPERKLAGSNLFLHTAYQVMEGQQRDMAFEGDMSITPEKYLQMIGGKTAALLAFCCEIGAVLYGEDPDTQQKLHEFGFNLGLAFQIYDDWLGIWGKEEQTGKPAYSDLLEHKISYPVLLGLSANGTFYDMWGQGISHSFVDLKKMAGMLSQSGVEVHLKEKVAYYNEKARNSLYQIDGDTDAKKALEDLIELLVARSD